MENWMSLVIIFLFFSLIAIKKLYYTYIKYVTRKIEEENEKDKLIFIINLLRKENTNLKLKISKGNYSEEIKEAVRYAMVKAHPDNGGKQEDFIRFQECYKRLK
ncbi:MAG: DnaJ domain-containing protein [Caudoviricetes sp.]|nr:MAG: DnaJ domain-containing protein [Caudoviricetes sp.]